MLSREQRIQLYKSDPHVSVLIVGAGINGIGAFWDLAMQGVDVLLIDRSDYSSGSSAASSHMVHGGIRYLENGEFRLVREAVHERNWLIENAPHLVKPLPTTFPIFKWFSGMFNAPLKFVGLLGRPSERGAFVIKLGMVLYDLYARRQGTVPRHVFMGRDESLRQFPALNPEIVFTSTYYDAAMRSPERIAIELVTDAACTNERAIPLNYISIAGIRGSSVVLRDETTGDQFGVIPRVVINAAGPWIDHVNRTLGHQTGYIGGTKGSHLVLDHPELSMAIGENAFYFENADGRIVLLLPLEDRVLLGTTDIRVDEPDQATVTDEEIRYLLDMIGRVFPRIEVDESHIVFAFSGVRPLASSKASLTGQISRDHKIEVEEAGGSAEFPVLSLVGGKWTTFRALAERASNQVLERLGLSRQISMVGIGIGGGRDYPDTRQRRENWISSVSAGSGLSRERVEALFSRYGTRAEQFAEHMASGDDQPLKSYPSLSSREIDHIVQNEDVVHLDDFLLRRSMIGILGRSSTAGLNELGRWIGGVKGWDESRIRNEIQRTSHILRSRHKVDLDRNLSP